MAQDGQEQGTHMHLTCFGRRRDSASALCSKERRALIWRYRAAERSKEWAWWLRPSLRSLAIIHASHTILAGCINASFDIDNRLLFARCEVYGAVVCMTDDTIDFALPRLISRCISIKHWCGTVNKQITLLARLRLAASLSSLGRSTRAATALSKYEIFG